MKTESIRRISGEIQREFDYFSSLQLVCYFRRRLSQNNTRFVAVLFIASYIYIVFAGSVLPTSVYAAPLFLGVALIADVTIKKEQTRKERTIGSFGAIVVITVSFTLLLISMAILSVIEIEPVFATQTIFRLQSEVVIRFVMYFLAIVIAIGYGLKLNDVGLGKSTGTAWIVLILLLGASLIRFPIQLSEFYELPSAIVIAGLLVQFFLSLLGASITEEVLTRGFFQPWIIKSSHSISTGIYCSSIFFSLLHAPMIFFTDNNFAGDLIGTICLCLVLYLPMGVVYGMMRNRTNSLKWPIIAHAVNNTSVGIHQGLRLVILLSRLISQ